jgi:hypothetical protein
VLAGASGQSRVTGRKEKKMIQIGARQAQGSFLPGKGDPSLQTKILTALAASRFSVRDEYLKFSVSFILQFHSLLRISLAASH